MTQDEAFLAGIVAHPEDPAARLVYADWLEDRGDPRAGYLRAQAGRIPELTRVIVAYQNQIVMERTLEAGLSRIFGTPMPSGVRPDAPPPPPRDSEDRAAGAAAPAVAADLAAEARAAYDRAIAAQRAGDWAKYGEEIRRLGEILGRMKASK